MWCQGVAKTATTHPVILTRVTRRAADAGSPPTPASGQSKRPTIAMDTSAGHSPCDTNASDW
eukprot:11683401-Alexandrium_andersonii.AAC.1